MEKKSPYLDNQFRRLIKELVTKHAKTTGQTQFNTAELKAILRENKGILVRIYRQVSWAQCGPRYFTATSTPTWGLFDFSDRFARNMRRVFNSTEGLGWYNEITGEYTVDYWDSIREEVATKKVPRHTNYYTVKL